MFKVVSKKWMPRGLVSVVDSPVVNREVSAAFLIESMIREIIRGRNLEPDVSDARIGQAKLWTYTVRPLVAMKKNVWSVPFILGHIEGDLRAWKRFDRFLNKPAINTFVYDPKRKMIETHPSKVQGEYPHDMISEYNEEVLRRILRDGVPNCPKLEPRYPRLSRKEHNECKREKICTRYR